MAIYFDFETRSKADLLSTGVHPYVDDPSFEPLCMSWRRDKEPAQLWVKGNPFPVELTMAIVNGEEFRAHNAAFERAVWEGYCVPKLGWPILKDEQLTCSMELATYHQLPAKLEVLAKELGVTNKLAGLRLIKLFCCPQKDGSFAEPADHPLDWLMFLDYCIGDVITLSECWGKLEALGDIIAVDKEFLRLDRAAIRRGVALDIPFIEAAVKTTNDFKEASNKRLHELTDGKVSSFGQFKALAEWLGTSSVSKEALAGLSFDDPKKQEVLELRAQAGSSSVEKYTAALNRHKRGRLHELVQVYGARTGRDAGRGVQLQNLPNEAPMIKRCTECGMYYPANEVHPYVRACETLGYEQVAEPFSIAAMEYMRSEMTTKDTGNRWFGYLAASVRMMLMSDEGESLYVGDFSSIEAITLAWLCGEQKVLDAFAQKQDLYVLAAQGIYGGDYESAKEHRKVGKIAVLASGYQGGPAAWARFGADKLLSEEQIASAVKAWRASHPNIVSGWYELERLFKEALVSPIGKALPWKQGVTFTRYDNFVRMGLPSGRHINYWHAHLDAYGKICFTGLNNDRDKGPIGWVKLDTYGGKLMENLVQAVARDLLVSSAVLLYATGYHVAFRVHDELIIAAPQGRDCKSIQSLMSIPPSWAAGLPLRCGEVTEARRYRK